MPNAISPLRAWRQRQSLTLRELSEQIGCSPPALHRYERGERTPRPAVLMRIRDVTGGVVTANDFLPPRTNEAAE